MSDRSETVVLLGASDQTDRYAYKAFARLRDHGHRVIPVHPRLKEIEGMPVISSLSEINEPVDTLTLYVNPTISEPMTDQLVALKPSRVLFNPGTESPVLTSAFEHAGIRTENACTLVLLNTGQY